MPGIFHVVFGIIVGLPLWYLTRDQKGRKKWDIFIVLVFALNNYTGPDTGNVLKKISKAIESDLLHMLGLHIHSYFGWIFWAPIQAFFFYLVYKGLVSAQTKKFEQKIGNSSKKTVTMIYHDYGDIYFATFAGGIGHLFIDAIGHSSNPTNLGNFVQGKIPLYTPYLIEFFAFLIPLYIIIVLILRHMQSKSISSIPIFRKNTILKILVLIGVMNLNALILFSLVNSENLVQVDWKNYDWMQAPQEQWYFMLGNAMEITHLYNEGQSATWWIVINMIPFLLLFCYGYINQKEIQIGKKPISLTLFSMLLFVAMITIGYLLQPLIGNISNKEYDFGIYIFIYATLVMLLLALLQIKGEVREIPIISK